MQKTEDGYRCTIRFSNKDYTQKEVIRMFEYLFATGEYATESDIFREGIRSLYKEKTEPAQVVDWDNRIKECATATADMMMERMQTMLDGGVISRGIGNETEGEGPCNNQDIFYVGMKPPEVAEELGEGVDDFRMRFKILVEKKLAA